jgi:hypothetical protein
LRILHLHHERMVQGACRCRGGPAGETSARGRIESETRVVEMPICSLRGGLMGDLSPVVLWSSCADQLQMDVNEPSDDWKTWYEAHMECNNVYVTLRRNLLWFHKWQLTYIAWCSCFNLSVISDHSPYRHFW